MGATVAKVLSAELEGVSANLIEVEVDLNAGLHAFAIVGLADKAVGEAKERVNSALTNAGVKPPNRENRRITVNLAPADVKKSGSHYDLAIAVGYLLATRQVAEFAAEEIIFAGELALNGRLRPMLGSLCIAEMARRRGVRYVFLPEENANEASAIAGVDVIGLKSLRGTMDVLEKRISAVPHVLRPVSGPAAFAPDLSEIKGQEHAKRALAIAAAGMHNLLLTGPPGAGKSMLARALTGILPALTRGESIEVTKVWSAAGQAVRGLVTERPFRAPHQTASLAAVVGGGSDPRPGEISLAHKGVLFLDEIPEFPRNILEALRAPLEDGFVHISRARGALILPSRFALVAAMNPCPCGYFGDPEKECRCGAYDIARYQNRISGPLLDRIDIQVNLPRLPVQSLRAPGNAGRAENESARTKNLVEAARKLQKDRLLAAGRGIGANSEMTSRETERFAGLDRGADRLLDQLAAKHLSPRGYYRLLKVARTIADLDAAEKINSAHLAEAFSYRVREE